MLSEDDVAKIRRDVDDGVRGPVLVKYIRLLLEEWERWRGRRDAEPVRPKGEEPPP